MTVTLSKTKPLKKQLSQLYLSTLANTTPVLTPVPTPSNHPKKLTVEKGKEAQKITKNSNLLMDSGRGLLHIPRASGEIPVLVQEDQGLKTPVKH